MKSTGSDWSYVAATAGIVNTTTAVTIKPAVVGQRSFIMSMQIMTEILGTATELVIRDGAGGTVIWRSKIPTTGITFGLPINFDAPLASSANSLLEVACLTASGSGAVYVNAQGYTAP